MNTLIRLACNIGIHLCQAVLDTLDGRRPHVDEPLPDDALSSDDVAAASLWADFDGIVDRVRADD